MLSDRCVVRFSRARRALVAVLAGSCCSLSAQAGGVDFQFNGSGISNWSDPFSWDIIGVPNAANHNAFVSGLFVIDPTILTLDINVTLDNFEYTSPMVQFVSQGRTMTIGGSATFNGGMPVNFNGGGLAGVGLADNFGVLNANSGMTVSLDGPFTNRAGASLNVINGNFTRNTGDFTNLGTINVTSSGNANSGVNGNSSLSNMGTLNFEPGGGGSRTFGINLDVAGGAFVNVNANTTFNNTSGVYTNSGGFTVAPGATATIGGSGVLMFNQNAGTIVNNGTFQSNGEVFNFNGGGISGNDIRINGGELNITADGPGGFDVISGTNFSGEIAPSQHVDVINSTLTAFADVTNRGQLNITSDGVANSGYTGTTLMNLGELNFLPGAGGSRTLDSNLINVNTVNANDDLALNNTSGSYTNQGVFNTAAGSTTTLGGSGVLSFNQDAGVLDNQGVFQSNGETFNFNGGTITGNDIQLNSGQLNITTPNAGNFDVIAGVTMTGDISNQQTVDVFNSTLTHGSFTNDGVLTVTSTGAANSSISAANLNNTGTLNLEPGGGGDRSLSTNLTNSGVVNANDNTSLNNTSGSYTNTGQFNVANGTTTTLSGSGVQNFNQDGGTLNNNGTFTVSGENFNFNGGVLTGNDIQLNSGQLNVTTPNAGNFDVIAGVTMTGDISNQQTVDVFNSTLTQGSFTNDGVLTVTSTGVANSAISAMNLNNTGTLNLEPGGGGDRSLSTNLANSGVVNANDNTSLNNTAGVYTNTGQFNIAAGTTTTLSGGSILNFNQDGGALNNGGTFTVSGENFNFNGGVLTGNDIQLNSGQLNVTTPNAGNFDVIAGVTMTGDISDQQTVDVFNSTLTQGSFTNDGVLTVTSTGVANSAISAMNLNNTGTLNLEPGGGGDRSLSTNLTNSGVVNANDNTSLNNSAGVYTNTGQFNIAVGTTTTLSGGSILNFNQDGGALNNNGTFTVSGENFNFNGGVLTGNDVQINGGQLNITTGNQGNFDVVAGTAFSGNISNQQTVDVFNSTLTASDDVTNAGRLTLTSTGVANSGYSGTTLVNEGLLEALPGGGGSRSLNTNLDNRGDFDVSDDTSINRTSGVHANTGVITIDTGVTLTVGGGGVVMFSNNEGGLVRGDGTVNLVATDVFNNNGTFAPRGEMNAPSTLTVTGNWSQASLGMLAIDVVNSDIRGIGHDVLAVSQDVSLDGLLVVSVFGNINPAESFTILTSDELTGTFANTGGGTVATTNGGFFDVIYTGDSVILTNYVPTPGSMGLIGLGLIVGLRRRR